MDTWMAVDTYSVVITTGLHRGPHGCQGGYKYSLRTTKVAFEGNWSRLRIY